MKDFAFRIAHLVVVLFGVSVLTFLLIRLLPGDPALSIAATSGVVDPATLEAVRERLGLNLPIWEQYWNWITNALRGDLGVSFRSNQPISAAIMEHLPVTLHLVIMSQVVSLLVAVPVALYVAPRSDRWLDRVVAGVTFALQAIPNYVLAIVGVLVFAVTLGWLPAIGYVPLSRGFWPSTVSLIIPTFAISALLIAMYIRVLRNSMIETLQMDYMLVGKSLGYSRRRLLWNFGLKPSLPPLVTVVGLNFGILIGATVVVEVIGGIRGLGSLLLSAISTRDYLMVQGLVLVFAVAYVVANFLADLIHLAIDPRVRVAR